MTGHLTRRLLFFRYMSSIYTFQTQNLPRGFNSSSNKQASINSTVQREKLVILGTGWGGYSVLRNVNKKHYDVIVVSPRNHFLFTPLLASTTVGTLEFRSIIEPVRNTGFRKTDHFHLSEAIGIDAKEKTLECQSVLTLGKAYKIKYDKLIVAVGALSNTFGVPGVYEHTSFLKEIADARNIRNRILSNFELALHPGISLEERKRLLHIVIVGGGPTGVEFGAELYDFLREDVSRLYSEEKDLMAVSLIEANKILSSFSEGLQAYAVKKIQSRKQMKLVQSHVTEVHEDGVKLSDGTFLPCGIVVWSTGLAPRPFVKMLDFDKNPSGQLLTDDKLRVLGDETNSIYALGDCADIQGNSLPCTAQVAERQGKYLCESLECSRKGENVKPFVFKNMGMLAYLGSYKALTDTPGVKAQGFHSWLLWRSAYLTRLGSWRLRMQVPIDWTKTLLFGRDTSRF
ncbi:internal alternative NAD(P)H-ubiquinone oxidoreductase A1, mitochondrial-like [Anneissia japonica]|uniref:internal alternative NAD(P)H-ubiquinone oxidoreductase A1, mitochondrial-like n=1 Tax=Anneissia japonica TaxID=1529436 RepID=UPI001425953F|nr:internal alternative NAD(P)H-ubiquinone oxidoreductase A1, mitochondrial-like [Anneissia japonica]